MVKLTKSMATPSCTYAAAFVLFTWREEAQRVSVYTYGTHTDYASREMMTLNAAAECWRGLVASGFVPAEVSQ